MSNKKESLEKFWQEKTGKKIVSYGRWLLAVGILKMLSYICLIIFCIISTENITPIILFSIGNIGISWFFIYYGVKIKNKQVPPNELFSYTTVIVAFIIIILIPIFLVNSTNDYLMRWGLLDILDLIILYDSIKYKVKWHGEYIKVYNLPNIKNKDIETNKTKSEKFTTIFAFTSFLVVFIAIAVLFLVSNITFYSEEIENEIISSETVYEETSELELGQERTKTYGHDGEKEVTYKIGKKIFAGEVSREEVDSKTIAEATNTIIEKGTKRYRFMWCSDNYYLYYYETDYNNNKNIGYTWSGEDACQKDGHGVRVNVADYPPPTRYYYYY